MIADHELNIIGLRTKYTAFLTFYPEATKAAVVINNERNSTVVATLRGFKSEIYKFLDVQLFFDTLL